LDQAHVRAELLSRVHPRGQSGAPSPTPQAISLVVATAQQVTGARRIASAGSSHTPSSPTDPVRHQQRQDHLDARTAEQARAADIRS
jgi:hypothetical protein